MNIELESLQSKKDLVCCESAYETSFDTRVPCECARDGRCASFPAHHVSGQDSRGEAQDLARQAGDQPCVRGFSLFTLASLLLQPLLLFFVFFVFTHTNTLFGSLSRHPLIKKLFALQSRAAAASGTPEGTDLEELCRLLCAQLYENALATAGLITDSRQIVSRMNDLLTRAFLKLP